MNEPIEYGQAKILPHRKGGWVIPGGSRVTDKETATKYAALVDFEMIRRKRK